MYVWPGTSCPPAGNDACPTGTLKNLTVMPATLGGAYTLVRTRAGGSVASAARSTIRVASTGTVGPSESRRSWWKISPFSLVRQMMRPTVPAGPSGRLVRTTASSAPPTTTENSGDGELTWPSAATNEIR